MAACINGNGVMSGHTDPGPKIARALIGEFSSVLESQRSARGDPHTKLLIMVRGSIHQRVKLIMNNHQGTQRSGRPFIIALGIRYFLHHDGGDSQGVSLPTSFHY